MPRPKTRTVDLQNTMLACTLVILETEGPSAVTARRIASDASSSTAAVYELFGDKGGLVRAVFLDGFRRLADLLEGLDELPDSRNNLLASFEVMHQFALESPVLFEVMYQRPFADFEPSAADTAASMQIYDHLVGRVALFLGRPIRSAAAIDASQALVSMNRGLIANELAGTLGSSKLKVRRRRQLALGAVLDGLESQFD